LVIPVAEQTNTTKKLPAATSEFSDREVYKVKSIYDKVTSTNMNHSLEKEHFDRNKPTEYK